MAKYEIIDGEGIIPEGTTIVEGDFLQSAFEDHESLKSVVFPISVIEIGSYPCRAAQAYFPSYLSISLNNNSKQISKPWVSQ